LGSTAAFKAFAEYKWKRWAACMEEAGNARNTRVFILMGWGAVRVTTWTKNKFNINNVKNCVGEMEDMATLTATVARQLPRWQQIFSSSFWNVNGK
jgi:hypothetical protein